MKRQTFTASFCSAAVSLLVALTFYSCRHGSSGNLISANYNSAVTGITSSTNSTGKKSVIAIAASVDNMASLPFARIAKRVTVKGFYRAGDGGGGDFMWDSSSVQQPFIGWIMQGGSKTKGRWKRINADLVTPEMFGALGDGEIRKLSTKYPTIEGAKKDYPGVKDLDITIDGAAFQEAVDVQNAKGGGEVVAAKKYAINFPIITKSNVTIDGQQTGFIYNDRTRAKYVHQYAFLIGDHQGVAFNQERKDGIYKLSDVANPVKAGQNFVVLSNAAESEPFHIGQLLLVCTVAKKDASGDALLPYSITMCKILKKDKNTLFFEYPFDEDIDDPQIASDGSYDPFMEIPFTGVENVIIRNFTIDARSWSGRWYGYKCLFENLTLINSTDLIVGNALAHSTIRNIKGTFSHRCIEIKTGSHDLIVDGVNAIYKDVAEKEPARSIISLGEFNRNITIENFKIDEGDFSVNYPAVTILGRKATISDGQIICKNQQSSFIKFFNDNFVPDVKYGCYGNVIKNVTFQGGPNIRNILSIGANVDNEKFPTNNVIDHCKFLGGSFMSSVILVAGEGNKITNCTFNTKRFIRNRLFSANNVLQGNSTQ